MGNIVSTLDTMIALITSWALYGFAVVRYGQRWRFIFHIPMIVGVLIATAPFWSLAVMAMTSSACPVNEGGPHPCIILGADFGDLLYTIGLTAMWGFFVLPVFAIAGGAYFLIHLPFLIIAERRNRAVASSPR